MKQRRAEYRALEQTQLEIALDSADKEVAVFQRFSAYLSCQISRRALPTSLAGDEICVAMSRNARHIVSRKRTRIVGQTAGISYKVSKNTRVRLGGFQGEPQTTFYDEEADTGTVYVTNQSGRQ